MDFNILAIILILIVAFLAGMEGILDQFQFHQPIIACSLIGVATGHIKECVMLGGALQLMALGWANVGAAVAPDAALASVASAIIFAKNNFKDQGTVIGTAVALATAGLVLTMVVRTLSVVIVHQADREAEKGNFKGVDIKELNVGSMAHSVGKVMVNNVLSMDQNDVDTYKKLRDLGVQFDVRKVAADKRADLFKLISEKQNEGLKL